MSDHATANDLRAAANEALLAAVVCAWREGYAAARDGSDAPKRVAEAIATQKAAHEAVNALAEAATR